jgi:Icc-related predicted phosphoesterase
MKALVAADVHGYGQRYDDLMKLANILDVKELWLAGDILSNSCFCYDEDIISQAQTWEQNILPKLQRGGFDTIRIIPGNDDFYTPQSIGNIIVYDKPTLVIVQNRRILFNPWLQHIDWTLFREHEEEEIKHFIRKEVGNSGIDIIISHQPPYGILDDVIDRFTNKPKRIGSLALCDCIHQMKPKIGVYGHVHDRAGETKQTHLCHHYNSTVIESASNAVLIDLDDLNSINSNGSTSYKRPNGA